MTRAILPFCLVLACVATASAAVPDPVPGIINHQGRIAVSSVNWTGTGKFKFSLIDGSNGTVLWHHDGTSTASAQPTGVVLIAVSSGLYSVALGDTSVGGMTAIPMSVFRHADVELRIWFNDSTNGLQQLSPDIRLAITGYAARAAEAASVDADVITAASVLDGSLTTADLSGTAGITDAQVNNNLTIVAGTVDNTPVGATTASTGKFTTLDATGTTRIGNLTTDFMSLSSTGVMTFTGLARPKRTTILMPAIASLGGSTTLGSAGASFPYKTVDFPDDNSTPSAAWQFVVPDSCAGGTIDVTLYWSSTSNVNNCDWKVDVDGIPADGATLFDSVLGNTASQSDPAPGTVGAVKSLTFAGLASGWTAGEIAVLKLSRTAGDSSTVAAKLVMVKVEWTASAESD
jgi:hypothetical protein